MYTSLYIHAYIGPALGYFKTRCADPSADNNMNSGLLPGALVLHSLGQLLVGLPEPPGVMVLK